MSRFSYRSFVATLSFFSTALITSQLFPAVLPVATVPLMAASSSGMDSLTTFLLLQIPFILYTALPTLLPRSIASVVSSFCIGVHFAFGLALAGMTKPSKVLGFFYLPFLPINNWDPSLAMVALGGLLPNIFVQQSIQAWSKPLYKERFDLPSKKDVDFKLCLGSAVFGIGWGESSCSLILLRYGYLFDHRCLGLSGLCPGPAVTVVGSSLGASFSDLLLLPFFASFIAGGVLAQL